MSNNETPLPDPPEDFGAALIAEFEKRGTQFPDDDDAPPGGVSVDATDIDFDIEAAAKQVNTETVADAEGADDGKSLPPGDVSDTTTTTPTVESDADHDSATTGADGADDAGEDEVPPPSSSPADDDTEPTTQPTGYTWSDGEQSHTFSDDEVRRGLLLNNWAGQLSDETRQAFAAIEQGQAVAISREDYEQFAAFKAQQDRSTRDADLRDLEAIDPDVAKIIAQQRDEIEALKQQTQPQQDYSNLHGNLDQTAMQIDAATRTYASAANIPVEQAEQFLEAATNSGVFRHFAEAQAQRHPMTGQITSPPNWNNVVKAALDYARSQMQPTQQTPPATQDATQTAPPAANRNDPNPPPDPGITAKKARAASVASAPSGATPRQPSKTKTMSQAERIQAMADEIAAATSRS